MRRAFFHLVSLLLLLLATDALGQEIKELAIYKRPKGEAAMSFCGCSTS